MFTQITDHHLINARGAFMPQGYSPYQQDYNEPGPITLHNGERCSVRSVWERNAYENDDMILLYVQGEITGQSTHITLQDFTTPPQPTEHSTGSQS